MDSNDEDDEDGFQNDDDSDIQELINGSNKIKGDQQELYDKLRKVVNDKEA